MVCLCATAGARTVVVALLHPKQYSDHQQRDQQHTLITYYSAIATFVSFTSPVPKNTKLPIKPYILVFIVPSVSSFLLSTVSLRSIKGVWIGNYWVPFAPLLIGIQKFVFFGYLGRDPRLAFYVSDSNLFLIFYLTFSIASNFGLLE